MFRGIGLVYKSIKEDVDFVLNSMLSAETEIIMMFQNVFRFKVIF